MAKTYSEGWDAYAAGRPIDDCTTDDARRGWWAANAAEAACLVVDYLFATGQAGRINEFVEEIRDIQRPEPGIEDDHEWIRRGC